MSICIEVQNLKRVYTYNEKLPGFSGMVRSLLKPVVCEKTAVDDFSFKVEKGELVGLIGPNGAGKTTLVKMLTGIIRPTAGTVSVLGYRPSDLKDDFKKRFAVVMGQKSQLWWDLPAYDSFLLNKELYEINAAQFKRNLEYFSDMFGIGGLMNKQARQLSLGERMKMELVNCLLHDPDVLFLDEPTIGLDAVAQKQVRNFLREVNRDRGVTVLLTSHYMDDIRKTCQRVVVINHGRKIYDGATDRLFGMFDEQKIVRVEFEDDIAFLPPDGAQMLEQACGMCKFKLPRSRLRQILQQLFAEYDVKDITVEEDDVGEAVEKIYSCGAEAML